MKVQKDTDQARSNEATISVGKVASVGNTDILMKGVIPNVEALETQFASDLREVRKMQTEQNSLREAYLRFSDLDRDIASKNRRLRSTGAILNRTSYSRYRDKVKGELADVGIDVQRNWEDNEPLWRIMREVVRQHRQVQVVTLCQLLYTVGFDVSRQSVESALRTHPTAFRITHKGREKYISLKGA